MTTAAAALVLAMTGAGAAAQTTAPAAAASAPTPPPATAFAREAAIASVDISPDGRHLAAVTSSDGVQRVVSIWRTDALDQPPFVIGSDARSEVVGVQFIKNDRIFVTTQQLVEHPERSYRTRTQVLDLQGEPVRLAIDFDGLSDEQKAFVGVGSLVSDLPRDPQSIIVSDPFRGDKYKVNLYTGRSERVERGSSRFSGDQADLNGEIRARQEVDFDNGAVYFGQWLKDPQSGEWAEHFRWYARDREPISIVGFSNDPNIVFVSSTTDRDHAAIYEYNIRDRALGEIAFAHPLFDATGVVRSTAPADFGEVLGFTYDGERSRTYWVDPTLADGFAQFRTALGITTTPVEWTDIASGERSRFSVGDGADVSVSAVSEDRSRFVLVKSGPQTPPEYHLLMDGRMRLIGRAYPELSAASLGETTLIQYPARDGLMIPAFLTKPDPAAFGDGPYPTIITPHGGPWARDNLGWDSSGWTQYFATRGYAVLQPQFRGSEGWGQRLWRAGDREWGGKMQDDNDDAVRHLITQGVADPGRVAMHGYSYGGYAAMMAAVRPNGLYQCSVAGAGPASIELFKKGTYGNRFLREFQHPTAEGVDPIAHVNNVSIPIYVYTGDRDTRVIPSESETFAAALRRAGKPVQIRILPDMEHTLNTWTPANFAMILTSIEEFYKDGCGPDGL